MSVKLHINMKYQQFVVIDSDENNNIVKKKIVFKIQQFIKNGYYIKYYTRIIKIALFIERMNQFLYDV